MPLVLIVLALFAAAGWSRRWNGDDAFVVFRVVDNVLSGDGAVYNVGERVEAETSPLPVAWLAVLIGLACAVAGLVAAWLGACCWSLAGSPRATTATGSRPGCGGCRRGG